MNCAKKIIDTLAPSFEKRSYYEAHMDDVKNILADGEQRAKAVAQQTMTEVHEAMKLG
jgi:tryptophanyl-tRNA synthetase